MRAAAGQWEERNRGVRTQLQGGSASLGPAGVEMLVGVLAPEAREWVLHMTYQNGVPSCRTIFTSVRNGIVKFKNKIKLKKKKKWKWSP